MDSANLILAAMVTPAMAYAGLAAAALPVLIHLFNRRRFRRIRWAATDFLLEAERRNRRRTRLEEMILLALRCLAMALLGAALARWFVQPRSLLASLGGTARTDHFILVDDSYSMGALKDAAAAVDAGPDDTGDSTAGRIFDDAKAATQRLVDHIRQVAPDDPVTMLVTSRPDRAVRSATSTAQVPPQAWTDDIQAMQPSARAGNMSASLKAIRELLDAREAGTRAAVYIISDFQAIDWAAIGSGTQAPQAPSDGETTAAAGPASVLAGWAHHHRDLELLLIDVGRPVPSNLGVAAIRPDQPQAVSGVVGRYHIRVANFGTQSSKPGEMRVYMGDTALPPVPLPALAPNQSADVPVELAFGQEGSQRLVVQLAPDALPADNTRSCAVPVERALRLLMVNGEASPDPYQDEAFLLNVALRPEGPEFSGNETVIINEDEFEVADLSEYHAVLLLNVNRVTHEMAGRLEAFAAAGGGVVFFLGDQVDTATYNRLLHRHGTGVLPAKLGDQLSVPVEQAGARIATGDAESPAAMRFGSAAAPLLQDALVWQYFSTDPAGLDTHASANADAGTNERNLAPVNGPADAPATAAASGEGSHSAHRPPARVLLRLTDADQSPLLIERPYGRGRVLLFTTSADKEWNNLPDQPVYVVLMMELVQHVARPSEIAADRFVGEPIRLSLDPAAYQPAALLKLPTYPGTPAIRLEARPDGQSGQWMLEWTDTNRPGLYQFDLRKSSGEEIARQVAVNLEPRESDLRRIERHELLASMGDLNASYVTGESLADRAHAEARQELWPALLMLLVGVLMLEQGLAWWFGADRDWHRAVRWTAS